MRLYFLVNITLFVLLALFHIPRLAYEWPIIVGDVKVPVWVSWPLLVVAFVMFLWTIRLYQANRPKQKLSPAAFGGGDTGSV